MIKSDDLKYRNQSILQKIQKLRNIIQLIQKENEDIINQLYPYDNWIESAFDSIIDLQGTPSESDYASESDDGEYETTSEGNTDDASDSNFKQEDDDLYEDNVRNYKEKPSKHKKNASLMNKIQHFLLPNANFQQQFQQTFPYLNPNLAFLPQQLQMARIQVPPKVPQSQIQQQQIQQSQIQSVQQPQIQLIQQQLLQQSQLQRIQQSQLQPTPQPQNQQNLPQQQIQQNLSQQQIQPQQIQQQPIQKIQPQQILNTQQSQQTNSTQQSNSANPKSNLIFTPAYLKKNQSQQERMPEIMSPIRPVIVNPSPPSPPSTNNIPNQLISLNQPEQNFAPLNAQNQFFAIIKPPSPPTQSLGVTPTPQNISTVTVKSDGPFVLSTIKSTSQVKENNNQPQNIYPMTNQQLITENNSFVQNPINATNITQFRNFFQQINQPQNRGRGRPKKNDIHNQNPFINSLNLPGTFDPKINPIHLNPIYENLPNTNFIAKESNYTKNYINYNKTNKRKNNKKGNKSKNYSSDSDELIQSETESEAEPDIEIETETESEGNIEIESDSDSDDESESEAKSENENDTKSESESEEEEEEEEEKKPIIPPKRKYTRRNIQDSNQKKEQEVPQVRKRGRPKKIESEKENVVKRKVGRPRKNPIPQPSEKKPQNDGQPVKRRVGRPPKKQQNQQDQQNQQQPQTQKDPTRRRGRPKKQKDETNPVNTTKQIKKIDKTTPVNMQTKRKVGRPPKSSLQKPIEKDNEHDQKATENKQKENEKNNEPKINIENDSPTKQTPPRALDNLDEWFQGRMRAINGDEDEKRKKSGKKESQNNQKQEEESKQFLPQVRQSPRLIDHQLQEEAEKLKKIDKLKRVMKMLNKRKEKEMKREEKIKKLRQKQQMRKKQKEEDSKQ